MITYRTLTRDDLKKDYSTRLGFVFRGPTKSSDKAIEHLCNILIQYYITMDLPEFVVRLDDLTTVFVYDNHFNSPAFFEYANIGTRAGICNIQSLGTFLNI